MKVLFANPPFVRSDASSRENGFALDGPVFRRWMTMRWSPVPNALPRLLRILGVGGSVRYGVRAGSRWPWTMDVPPGAVNFPFILAYAASYLRGHGVETALIDAVAEENHSYDRFVADALAHRPDIIVIETSTPTLDIDLWLAERLSAHAEVALAGTHVATEAEKVAPAAPFVKYWLKGEYIKSALAMAKTRRPGFYEADVVRDLDAVPEPLREFPASHAYFDPSMPTAKPQLQMFASKGCPFRCIYCQWPRVMYKDQFSPRDPKKIADEIRRAADTWGYRSVFFDDDTFNIGNDRVSALCDELAKVGLPWTMMGRIDTSPDALFDKMVDCGCVGMRFGIETFDAGVAKAIKKNLERETVFEILKYITTKHPKVMIHLTMMKDLPGQTEAIHQNDVRLLTELGYTETNPLRSYQMASCAPFPGTELYRTLQERGFGDQLANYVKYDGGRDTVMTKIEPRG